MLALHNVQLTLDRRGDDEDLADRMLDRLANFHVAAGVDDRGRMQLVMTVPAGDVSQAVQTCVGVARLVEPADVVDVIAMTTTEWDRRQGLQPMPDLLSLAEAAALLGITRQAVMKRINHGSLPAQQVGNAWVVPAAAIRPPELQ